MHETVITSETKTFHGSHYSSDKRVSYIICSCGWKSGQLGDWDEYTRTKEFYILEHKVDVLLKEARIKFVHDGDALVHRVDE